MSWKNKLPYHAWILVSSLAILVAALLSYSQLYRVLGVSTNENQDNQVRRILTYSEDSPDGTKQIIRYKFNNHPELFTDYRDYLNNNIFITLKDLVDRKETYVFVGEAKTNDPHWLGNHYIFFTTYCGTACKGIYLVNILNKESNIGVLSYVYSDQNNMRETHFKDWFDHKFELAGWVKDIRSVYLDGNVYLIFEMWNNNQYLGGKRFLFTDDSLKEQ